MTMRLSICIPTFNRAGLLRETLDSIICQARDALEIVVCDNASSDATRELIQEYQGKFPRLTYFRWPENMGADRNFLKTVELATGDYCWLMGDDDHLEPGALDLLFPLLDKGYGLIYANATTYDNKMENPSGLTVRRFNCDDADQTLLSLSSWITFASSLCFRRSEFMKHLDLGLSKIGTNLVQCYPLLNLIRQGRSFIVQESLVRFRAGNTSGYGIFQVFIEEFGRLLEYGAQIGFSRAVVREVKTQNVYKVIVPSLLQIKLGRLDLKAESIRSHLAGSGLRLREKLLLTALASCPAAVVRGASRLRKMLKGKVKTC